MESPAVSPIRLQFLGCGDAFGTGGRMNTCIWVDAPAARFLIDCGASAMISMRKWQKDPAEIDTILVSHLHGDHFGGLPFFLLDARYISKREKKLRICGPSGIEDRTRRTMEVLYPDTWDKGWNFELEFIELEALREQVLPGMTVVPYLVEHPSGAPSHGLRITTGDRTIAFSGDTQWTDTLIPLADQADLFICECYGFDKQVRYHLDYQTLLEKQDLLTCKRMMLTHFGDEMLKQKSGIIWEYAEDGLSLTIP